MLLGWSDAQRDLLDAHRLMGLARLAHTMAAIFNAAPFREGDAADAKKIFEALTQEEDLDDDTLYDWQICEDGIARRVPKVTQQEQ